MPFIAENILWNEIERNDLVRRSILKRSKRGSKEEKEKWKDVGELSAGELA